MSPSSAVTGPDDPVPGKAALRRPPPSEGLRLVRELRRVAGETVRGVILFGSQLVQASPGRHSAWDLVVVVDDYEAFYRRYAEAGHHRRSPRTLAALARILPPNVVAFFPDGPRGITAKCMILDRRHFARALSSRAPDHFVKGRMVQQVRLLFAADERDRSRIQDLLARARLDVLRWVGPYLEEPFDAGALARRMLQVSYRGEVRPESGDRVAEVFEAQEPVLREMYREVLSQARDRGRVEPAGEGRWRLADPPGAMDGLRVRAYFLRSKLRATVRWLKHVLTFDDWLTYIQRKVERRTGMEIEITPVERRFPLILLWPKVFRVLAGRESGSARDRESAREGDRSSPSDPDVS